VGVGNEQQGAPESEIGAGGEDGFRGEGKRGPGNSNNKVQKSSKKISQHTRVVKEKEKRRQRRSKTNQGGTGCEVRQKKQTRGRGKKKKKKGGEGAVGRKRGWGASVKQRRFSEEKPGGRDEIKKS